MFRLRVTDVAFLHKLRDEFLLGAFDKKLQTALQDTNRMDGCDILGAAIIGVDHSHFAEIYESSILQLNKLTPHQRERLDMVRQSETDVHIQAPAGAGKTFVAVEFLMRCMREDRMLLSAQTYIANTIGKRYIDSRPLDLKAR